MENQSNNKSISNFKSDAVAGESIVGGAGKIIMPTLEDEANGINNSGFTPDQGHIPGLVDDGTVFTTNADGTE